MRHKSLRFRWAAKTDGARRPYITDAPTGRRDAQPEQKTFQPGSMPCDSITGTADGPVRNFSKYRVAAGALGLALTPLKFSHRCAGRPARSRWCKSTTMKK